MSDETATIRDLFYPQVGQFNHLAGGRIRIGCWTTTGFVWLDDPEWQRELWSQGGRLTHAPVGLELEFLDVVHPSESAFERQLKVTNLGEAREVRLFFAPDLRIAESDIGDTAMYHPGLDAMVHFKRDHWFAFRASCGESGIAQFSTGYKDFKEFVGTWLDAEDGELSGKPIEQGSVDSVFAVHLRLEPNETKEVRLTILAAGGLQELQTLQDHTRGTWPTANSPVINGVEQFATDLGAFLTESLRLVETQIDGKGAILAANDSDILEQNRATYSYCWPRDGAYVAVTLIRAGRTDIAKSYFEFCAPLLSESQPVFHQKYGPDGTVGATWHPYIWEGEPILPFQQDETCLTIWALSVYAEACPDDKNLPTLFRQLVEIPMNFLVGYVDDKGLPQPSWDLWEERRGVHAHTVAATVAGFRHAASLASRFGTPDQVATWKGAADRMLAAWNEHGWNPSRNCYFRMLNPSREGYTGDETLDSAVLAFDDLGLSGEMPMFESAYQTLLSGVRVETETGGFARYEGDYYFRQVENAPGNPWIICTMWFARAAMRRGDQSTQWLEWAHGLAHATGVLSEQYHPVTKEPLSVSPLTWSHAEVLETALLWLRQNS